VTLPAATFPEEDLYTWNQFAPRIGMTFDLTGDGKTVLKGNYGLFWHNPGVGVGSDSNPNTPGKSVTYAWNDRNGDRIWQPGEEGNETGRNVSGSVFLDPDIEAPVTHEATTWLERQITDTMGVRAGYVYKTEDNLIGVGVPGRDARNGAYSQAFTFNDIGADNVRGTADDQVLTLYGMPTSQASQFPLTQYVENLPRQSRYDTFEVSMNRRYAGKWSAQIGGAYTWMDDFIATVANSWPRNPNLPGQLKRTVWNLKATGSYDAAWGIRLSPVLRHQSGGNYAREISVPSSAAPAGVTFPAPIIYADDPQDNRIDNIWVFDVRAEKTVNLGSRARTRLFLDFFNITNSSASEDITRTTGVNYQRPSAILAPRTMRLGFRVLW
jgi:hypothetical protein